MSNPMIHTNFGYMSAMEASIIGRIDKEIELKKHMETHAVLYTKPNCQACKQTTRLFDRLGYPYENTYYGNSDETNAIDITAADKRKREWSLRKVESLKAKYHIQQLPLVKIVDDDGKLIEYWSGFQMNKIREYAGDRS